MLRITMNKSAAGAKKYYSESYYREGQNIDEKSYQAQGKQLDYYSEKNEVIGKWGGSGAAELDLGDNINKKDFAALCDNINPLSRTSLTTRNDVDRRVGYDFTFNASKSVSLAHAFGSEADKKVILEAFQSSVHETMTEIEGGMQARVRDKGKNENRETGNIVYGEFTHFTTRPIDGVPDPHLHSHCFIFNATYDMVDKKWKAGEFGQIKQDAPYYEAVFHSKLAQKLENVGYRVEQTKNGFELVGIDKKVIDQFSRRTKEIEDYSKEHNITDEKQKSQIGAKTREAKRVELTPALHEAEWEKRIGAEELEQLRNLRIRSAEFTPKSENREAAKEAVQYSLDHHLERKSVASDKEILSTAIRASIGKTSVKNIKKEFEDNKDILKVKEKLRTFITTKDALKEEKDLIQKTNASKGKYKPINENYTIKNEQLNDQQQKAVKHVLSTSDGISIITGKAGTGKTTLMKEVQAGIIESGKQIYSYAPSSEASRGVQRSEGFRNADTVASLITNKEKHADMKNQVIWVDEAGLLSNKDMNQIIDIANRQNARIILSGDTKQHNSVQRGDALRIMQKYAGVTPITIDRIQRQKNEDYKQAVKWFSNGDVDKGFKKLENIGSIKEVADHKERLSAIAEDYYNSSNIMGKQATKNVLVVAPTHAEGEVVTQHIRQKLKENDIIGKEDKEYKVLKNLQFTDAEKQVPENYPIGCFIVTHKQMKGIKHGSKLEVMGFEGSNLMARDAKGLPYNVPVSQHDRFSVFEMGKVLVSRGDKIRITHGGKAKDGKRLFNGSCYSIHAFDKDGNIRLSNGSTITQDFNHFNLGYVVTSHSSQGKTADKVIISQSSATFGASSMEQFYVSVSRGREAASIYTDDKEHLKQVISHSSERKSATELLGTIGQTQISVMAKNKLQQVKNVKDGAVKAYDLLITKFRQNELQRTNRTEPRKTR